MVSNPNSLTLYYNLITAVYVVTLNLLLGNLSVLQWMCNRLFSSGAVVTEQNYYMLLFISVSYNAVDHTFHK